MKLATYFSDFKEAQDSQDPHAMIEATQKFFTEIYALKLYEEKSQAKILGLYSSCNQLERAYGLDTKVIKEAIRTAVQGFFNEQPHLADNLVQRLNHLLIADGLGMVVKDPQTA